jgi:hypothetical protein
MVLVSQVQMLTCLDNFCLSLTYSQFSIALKNRGIWLSCYSWPPDLDSGGRYGAVGYAVQKTIYSVILAGYS